MDFPEISLFLSVAGALFGALNGASKSGLLARLFGIGIGFWMHRVPIAIPIPIPNGVDPRLIFGTVLHAPYGAPGDA